MSSLEDLQRKRHKHRSERKRNAELPAQSSRLGYVIIVLCVGIMMVGVFLTQQFDQRVSPQPPVRPTDAVNAGAISSTWTCPISGADTDSLLLSNPDSKNDGHVIVEAYDEQGAKKGTATITLQAGHTEKMLVSAVGADDGSSIIVQSFVSPVVVVRNLELSDGEELVPCINDPVSVADFPHLETIRNTNAVLVVANPYEVPIVVDLLASLTDTSVSPATSLLDEERGVIVPARGRVNIDLQAEFGRYPVVSVNVRSRSGFFVAEALQSFTGADSIDGQTIVARTHETTSTNDAYWVGVAPTRIVARNDSEHTHSIQVDALASDNRSISGESQIVTTGSTVLLENIGSDFSTRLLRLGVAKSSHRPSKIFQSWIYSAGNAVSSGSSTLQPTERAFVPVAVADVLYLYNPHDSNAQVSVSIFGTSRKITVELSAKQFKAVSLSTLGVDVSTILDVESDKTIVSGAGDTAFTHYAQGIEIRS